MSKEKADERAELVLGDPSDGGPGDSDPGEGEAEKADLGVGGPNELIFEDGTAVAAYGLGIHQIKDGKRHWVPDTWTQTKLGITWKEIVMLFPAQLLSIPEGAPIPSKAPAEPLF